MINKEHIITITTLHDPESRMIPMINQIMPALIQEYGQIVVVCTKETTELCVHTIQQLGGMAIHNRGIGYVKNYQLAVQKGLELTHNDEKIFYCDFDRLLHWYKHYPQELQELLKHQKIGDFLIIGRTPRAFATHPMTQTSTESLINQIGSKILGFESTRDVIVASWICNQTLAKRLLALKTTTKTGFYVFWPIMMWLWATQKQYIEMEGQEWETPDRYLCEIEQLSYIKWVESWQKPEEWQKRAEILRDSLDELNAIMEIKAKSVFN